MDNNGIPGEATELPALGAGTAQVGSAGALLVTDRTVNIPAYFVGNWVQINSVTDGTLEGIYRVASVSGVSMTLEDASGLPISVDEGDLWQGLYQFDTITVINNARLQSVDPIFQNGLVVGGG